MIDIPDITLAKGSHDTRESGMCLMEAVAWIAGEPHSDHPACVCPVIAAAGRALNDRLDDAGRQQLVPYIPRMIGTRGSAELEWRRAFAAADWAVRVAAPRALRAAGLEADAARLEALAPVVDVSSARAAADDAARAANAARASAAYTASAAAASAAYTASDAAVYAASGAADYAADAADSASDAASYAASDASDANAAIELLERLLEVT